MEKKTLLRLMVILLALSYVLYTAAVPTTRSSMIWKMDPSVQDHLSKEDLILGSRNMKEGIVESRMMMDIIADYPGARANPAHDPKPGKP